MTKQPKNNDAFGQLLLSWLQGGNDPEIVERDDGFINASDKYTKKLYFASCRRWPTHERRAIQLVHGRVLDAGAGAGRHTLELQRRHHRVTAIDISPGAIAVCKRRGVKDARLLSIDDVGTLPKHSFDTIIMLGNNFGLLQSHTKCRRILRELWSITTENGRIVAETMDPYKTKNPDHRFYHRLNRQCGRMGGQLRIRIRYRRYVGAWRDYLCVSKEELRVLLNNTGWELARTIDDHGPGYIAIIEKSSLNR